MTTTYITAEAELLDAIDRWSASPEILARFYNTLSFLEHVGSRKILASGIEFSAEELRHAFEETGHALRFKTMAMKLDVELADRYDETSMLGGVSPKYYFQKLDAVVRRFATQRSPENVKKIGYLLVTYLVEKRAATLYPAIHAVMQKHSLPVSLRSIIAEEDKHLDEVESAMGELGNLSAADLNDLREQEADLFSRMAAKVISAGDKF